MDVARRMWTLFEPVHAVTYFAPQARAAFEAAGLRGFWRGYFAGRAAPLGAVGAGPVQAMFFGFAPAMVRRALPDVWARATPAAALTARLDGARAALQVAAGHLDDRATPPTTSHLNNDRATPPTTSHLDDDLATPPTTSHLDDRATPPTTRHLDDDRAAPPPAAPRAPGDLAEAAALLRRAAEAAGFAGRPLGAANADLSWPEDPVGTLWQAATVLREHRGDGHVAALLVAGLDGAESLVWRASLDSSRDLLQPPRGWTDQEWAAAAARLTARGWLSGGVATAPAYAARDAIERQTDDLAAAPWRELGPGATARLEELLTPVAQAARRLLPYPNPIGLPPPAA